MVERKMLGMATTYQSKYQHLANKLHGKTPVQQPQLSKKQLQKIWDESVNDEESAKEFFLQYYPNFYDENIAAMHAKYIKKAMDGEYELPEKYLKGRIDENKWNWEKELEEARTLGRINLAKKKMELLLQEEEEESAKKK